MASYLKLIHNGMAKTVALYDGIDPQELTGLLSTVFNIQGQIVGIMGEKGLVVPLTLICKNPEVAPNSVCKVLVVGGGNLQKQSSEPGSAGNDNASRIGNSITSDAAIASEDYSQMVSEDDSVEYVTQEIQKFLLNLQSQRFLTVKQHRQLKQLLADNSNLLFAAYSVAVSANDSEYFAEICKDLASSLETEQGRSACEAQDEVLQICDQLYINEKITENQLLYLRHLVLIREEAVAQLYDEFQEHQSVPLFAKALYELANTHPFQTASSAASNEEGGAGKDKGISLDTEDVPSSSDSDEEEEDEEEPEEENEEGDEEVDILSPQVPKRKSSAAIARGLTGVISLMGRSALLSKTEVSVLYELIEQENEYVFAAYELYEKNKNLEDLQDTLLRCVKLEIRKRVTDIQEKELEAMQQERQRREDRSSEEEDDDDDEEEEGDGGDNRNYEKEKREDSEDNSSPGEISLEDISLSTLLQSLNVINLWEKTVPELFIKTVFIAVIRNQLTVEQGKAVCDLFHARYDLVHAAWEVFTVQRDSTDFIDTLRRIIRDVGVDELREDVEKEMDQEEAEQREEKTPHPKKEQEEAEEEEEEEEDDAEGRADAISMEQTLQDRKAEAMLAVTAAKRELLKHSLEMMVKQKMTTSEKAQDLYSRYLSGDVLTDAAIEAYASDRDVGEFLDTLQVLANNSKEDLDLLMRAVAAENNEASDEAAAKKVKEDIALSQIEEIVNEMLKSDMIGPGIAEEFRKLIRNRDNKLIEAYAAYQQNKSGAELVNSLLKIVIAAVEATPKMTASSSSTATTGTTPAATASGSHAKETPAPSSSSSAGANDKQSARKEKDDDEEEEDLAEASAALDPEDQKTVVDILMRANAIDSEKHKGLSQLIDQGNRRIARIFLSYEENKNVYALIDALREVDVAALLKETSAAAERKDKNLQQVNHNRSNDKKKSSNEEEEEEEEGEEYEEDFDEDDGMVVEEKFMEIIQNMQLSDLETAALRLAIAENDPSIRNAIDRFRVDLDEAHLMRAMKDAARSVIQRTLSSRMGQAVNRGAEAKEKDEKGQKEGGSDKSSPSQSLPKTLLSPAKAATNSQHYEEEFDEIEELDDEDGEEEEEEDDDDDNNGNSDGEEEEDSGDDGDEDGEEDDDEGSPEEGTGGSSLLLSQSARDHIFPILVQELVKENIISKSDGRIILQEFAAGNPVISTALDIYDRDNEMGQLVESLQQMVDNIQKA